MPEFRDHMIFRAGPTGRVVIENDFADPVSFRVLIVATRARCRAQNWPSFLAGLPWLAQQ